METSAPAPARRPAGRLNFYRLLALRILTTGDIFRVNPPTKRGVAASPLTNTQNPCDPNFAECTITKKPVTPAPQGWVISTRKLVGDFQPQNDKMPPYDASATNRRSARKNFSDRPTPSAVRSERGYSANIYDGSTPKPPKSMRYQFRRKYALKKVRNTDLLTALCSFANKT